MSDAKSKDRDKSGKFLPGNKVAKKDFTKEMMQHVAAREMQWAINQCCTEGYNEEDGEKSLFMEQMVKKVKEGDIAAIKWLWEMALGKPKQQQEHSGEINMPTIIIKEKG